MSIKQIKLTELDLGFQSDVGAPYPTVLSDERNLYLLFFILQDKAREIAIIHFKTFSSFKFGGPNDEAIQGHPYYKYGLHAYTNYIAENSDWIEEIKKIDSVHPRYNPDAYKDLKHYLFFFHDRNFECLADSYEVEKMNCSMDKAIKIISKKLNK